MPDKIRIFIKRPDVAVEAIEVPNTLEALQELVGGYIEVISLFPNIVIVVNEEASSRTCPSTCISPATGCAARSCSWASRARISPMHPSTTPSRWRASSAAAIVAERRPA